MKKVAFSVLLSFAFLFSIMLDPNLSPAYAQEAEGGITAGTGSSVIQIDGSFQDWANIPYSYEFNSNNPYQFVQWNPVDHKNETVTITDENGKPYNTTIRHKMQLYRDDKNVYLHIIIAKNYASGFNGYDYEFWCDGQQTIFQVVMPGGGGISNGSFGPGIHPVEVRHGAGSISWSIAKGAQAVLKRNPGGVNDELEMKLPLSELHRQNPNIDADNIRVLEFISHNLMYRRISCAGTDTMPYVGAAVCAVLAGTGCFLYLKKRKKCK